MEISFYFLTNLFMKKLQLNKKTIAQLNNPDKIFGGGEDVTFTRDAYNRPMTCQGDKTCDGPASCGNKTCGDSMFQCCYVLD